MLEESFKVFSRQFQMCFKEDGRVFQGRLQGVSRVFEISGKFQRFIREVFQGSFKGVPRKFLGCLKEVSWKIEASFNGALSGFQVCLKEVEWVFEVSFQGVSRMFQGNFKGVSRKIERSSLSPLVIQEN